MPTPKPNPNESEPDYFLLEKFMREENILKPESEKRSNEEISAICYSTWRERKS